MSDPKFSHDFISRDASLQGSLKTGNDIRVEGTLEGNLTSESNAHVTSVGMVDGKLVSSTAEIEGTVTGDVEVYKRLTIRQSATVEANVKAARLIVDPGATVKGQFVITPHPDDRRMAGDSAVSAPAEKEAQPDSSAAEKKPVSFTARFPEAKSVVLVGSFNDWKPDSGIRMKREDGGEWKGTVSLAPGRYEYLFHVDGSPKADPSAKESVSNQYGGTNSVIHVS